MPEGPEVAIVTDWLEQRIVGYTIEKIDLHQEWLDKVVKDKDWPHVSTNFNPLLNTTIRNVCCVCKRILMITEELVLVSSLGMEGMWTTNPWQKNENHHQMVLSLRSPDSGKLLRLTYQNHRPIGFIFVMERAHLEAYYQEFGFDLLFETPSPAKWDQALGELSNTAVKYIFSKDKGLTGSVGNYLRSEILYRAKLNPHKKVKQLTPKERETLRIVSINTIRLAYKQGGMTSNSFYSPDKVRGSFTAQVYNCTIDPHGNKVITEAAGQTLHWVPEVQK